MHRDYGRTIFDLSTFLRSTQKQKYQTEKKNKYKESNESQQKWFGVISKRFEFISVWSTELKRR